MSLIEYNVVAQADPLIEEKYAHPVDLLDELILYYPRYSEKIGVNNFHYVGKGADAYVFNIGEKVYKFTQNTAHAQAAHKILDFPGLSNVVNVYDVVHLPLLGMYLITEEYLHEVPDQLFEIVSVYFNGDVDIQQGKYTDQLDNMIVTMNGLGITEWDKDCFSEHNILYDPVRDQLKLFDFGYTVCKIRTEIPEVIDLG